MTELLTNTTQLESELWPARGIAFKDKVRMHFMYRHLGESAWSSMNYTVNADVVSGPQENSEGFQPYLLPEVPLPEGEVYANSQPRRMDESPFIKQLPDGTPIEVRYVVQLLDETAL